MSILSLRVARTGPAKAVVVVVVEEEGRECRPVHEWWRVPA